VFDELHRRGLAHSVETWREKKLVGGTYGLALGAAFFAESKFSRETDASKVALVHLVARLKAGGFRLLDAQFPNPHLEQFGAIAVPELKFEAMLAEALMRDADFTQWSGKAPVSTSSSAPVSGSVDGVAAGSVLPGAPDTVGGGGRTNFVTTGAGGGGGAGSSVMQLITQTS
jgi:leucyl/phenylalanyl-tRNA--protein transferase